MTREEASSSGELRFDGRVAIVTGGGRGLGRSHAIELARRGASVVVADLGCELDGTGSDPRIAEDVAAEIVQAGGHAVANGSDVRAPEGGDSVVATALEAFGRVDILVSSIGMFTTHPAEEWADEDLARHLALDPTGSLNIARSAWPHLKPNSGRIVLSLSSALFGLLNAVAYATAKGATFSLGRCLAASGVEYGVKVNMIAPYGFTRLTGARPRAKGERNLGDTAWEAEEALLPPASVSALVAYLAHDSCNVTGELFGVGGGRVTRVFLAETSGFTKTGIEAEDVRDNIERLAAEDGYTVVTTNQAFSERFHDHVPNFKELTGA